jgi:hypothetical protein
MLVGALPYFDFCGDSNELAGFLLLEWHDVSS